MAHEVETKVLDVDVESLKEKLISLGAKKIQDSRLIVFWYRLKGVREGEDPWFLRIRSYAGDKHEVTWKARSDILGTARKHKEINFYVTEPEKLGDLFEEMGLERYAQQEKDRTSFTYKDWQFDIDKYPNMPAFLEIEGWSEDHVREAIKILGLQNNRTWAEGERILIQNEYHLDWYHMKF